MNNFPSNVFFINMQKNIGKRTLIENIVNKLNGTIWEGVDKSIYDNNGILLNSFGHNERSRAAKEAKLNLFEYFLQNCSHDYLVLFEDDISIHKNFYKYFDEVIKYANTHPFKLIYMGVSSSVPTEYGQSESLNIINLPNIHHRYSGAYGVIIHRSILNKLIHRSNDPFLYNKPFDVYALGHIQESYPSECFISIPQLVIPDITISDIRSPRSQDAFWRICNIDRTQYVQYHSLPVYILSDSNKEKIKQFIGLISMFIPYIRPIFITKKENDPSDLYDHAYETIFVENFSNCAIKNIITHSKYAITNIYVNWTKNIGNIFDETCNVSYIINDCPKCSNLLDKNFNKNVDSSIKNGLSIIMKANGTIETKSNCNLFYVIYCKIDADGNMHCAK